MAHNFYKNDWLTHPGRNEPPSPFLTGTDDPLREELKQSVINAGKYAIRCSTLNGTAGMDYEALLQNLVVGLLGYNTSDGTLSGKLPSKRSS